MEMYPDPEWDAIPAKHPLPQAMVSSSPLKTAESISTVKPSTALMSSVSAYLSKYCEVASGGRVVFQGMHGFTTSLSGHGWFRFKCTRCQDNWNVKADLFHNNTNPKELTDWVEQHKHVCNDFSSPLSHAFENPKCTGCGWAWNQHKAAQPTFNIETGQWQAKAAPTGTTGSPVIKLSPGKIINVDSVAVIVPLYEGRSTGVRPCAVCEEMIAVASGSSICDACFKAAKTVYATKALTQTRTQGRMFRTKEATCESPKGTNLTNSNDSANSMTPVSQD